MAGSMNVNENDFESWLVGFRIGNEIHALVQEYV